MMKDPVAWRQVLPHQRRGGDTQALANEKEMCEMFMQIWWVAKTMVPRDATVLLYIKKPTAWQAVPKKRPSNHIHAAQVSRRNLQLPPETTLTKLLRLHSAITASTKAAI